MSIEEVRGQIHKAIEVIDNTPGAQADRAWTDVSGATLRFVTAYNEALAAAQALVQQNVPDALAVTSSALASAETVESELHGLSATSGRQEAEEMRNAATAAKDRLNETQSRGAAFGSSVGEIAMTLGGMSDKVDALSGSESIQYEADGSQGVARLLNETKSAAEKYDATL
jgi:hypothetical protein